MRSNILVSEIVAVYLGSDSLPTASRVVSSGTSSPATFSKHSVSSPGYAGLLPTTSPSTRCLVTSTVWVCPSSLLIGPKSHTSVLPSQLPGGPRQMSPSASSSSFGSSHQSCTTPIPGALSTCPSHLGPPTTTPAAPTTSRPSSTQICRSTWWPTRLTVPSFCPLPSLCP